MVNSLVPLGELGEILSGSTPDTSNAKYWGGDIPWITPADLTNHEGVYFTGELRKITEAGYKSCSTKMLPAGSILFSSRAPIGHCAVTTFPLCTNQGFKSIIPNEKLDSVYGFFALKYFTPQIEALGRGATFAEVNKEIFESFAIPLPPLPEQKRIASLLKRADRLRQLRRTAHDLGDSLLQSVFLEMFGDPITNPKHFQVEFLGNLGEGKYGIVDGPFGSSVDTSVDYISDGEIPVIRSKNIRPLAFDESDLKFMSREKYETVKRSKVSPGDILLVKVGATIGDTCIFPDKYKEAVLSTTGSCRITPNKKLINPIFFLQQLYLLKPHLQKMSSEAVQPFLNMTTVKEIQLLLPPLSLQEEFAGVVRRVESLRGRMAESERQVEGLFEAMLSESFDWSSGN